MSITKSDDYAMIFSFIGQFCDVKLRNDIVVWDHKDHNEQTFLEVITKMVNAHNDYIDMVYKSIKQYPVQFKSRPEL